MLPITLLPVLKMLDIWTMYRSSVHLRCCVKVFQDFVLCCAGEGFPSAKLAALQKVLMSDFFSAVREVYEHVYETVDLSGSVEVRANATAKVRTASYQL